MSSRSDVADVRELAARKEKTPSPDMSDIMDGIQRKSRDHARNPMQWDDSRNAGFSKGKPWMRVHDDYPNWNVAKQVDDPNSILSFWRAMLAYRKRHPACVSPTSNFADKETYGLFTDLSPANEEIYAFTKQVDTERLLVLLNFTDHEAAYDMTLSPVGTERFGNYPAAPLDGILRPYEAVVIVLDQ